MDIIIKQLSPISQAQRGVVPVTDFVDPFCYYEKSVASSQNRILKRYMWIYNDRVLMGV